ncbi:RagB/SusD family nutrient uptake outer membrane protein, partial [Pedobacter sp. UBA5917]|uniref:RagB/SusD family nutrient uptake outer membrane protein n=1 Tax=Pedobacter sp. UBA5917 TaxID=1947061 RepID=UPI0025F79234
RRLEFAFEGQRAYDLFRNNRSMVRNYPGTHALNNTPNTNITQTILPTDARVIFYVPQYEIDNNKNLTQNP